MPPAAARHRVPVAPPTSTRARRKTDRRDAFVLADTGRIRRHQEHWLDAGNDELLANSAS